MKEINLSFFPIENSKENEEIHLKEIKKTIIVILEPSDDQIKEIEEETETEESEEEGEIKSSNVLWNKKVKMSWIFFMIDLMELKEKKS